MDRLKAMHTFTRIAETGSLTAAAHELGSSLPATVRSLAALEAHLGVRLLNRTTRRISLTEEGKRYLDTCRQVLAAVEDAETALTADAAEPSGRLSITAPVLFGQMHVAPAVTRFVQRYDKMRCSLQLHDRVVNLLEEGIDVGIRISKLDDSTLVAQQLGSIRRVVVASPDYLRRHGTPQHPRELLKANCVRFVASGAAASAPRRSRRAGIDLRRRAHQFDPADARIHDVLQERLCVVRARHRAVAVGDYADLHTIEL